MIFLNVSTEEVEKRKCSLNSPGQVAVEDILPNP